MDSNANLLASLTQSSTRRAASEFRRVTEGFQPGQELVSTDVTLGGQYNVAVQRTPKTNAALKFASSLQQGVQVYGQAVNVAQKDAAEKVAAMSDEEFEKAYGELLAQQGETDPSMLGTILGRDKQFQQSMVDRWFRDVAPSEVKSLQDALKSEIQNFKTTAEFDAYVNKAVDDYFAEKSTQFSDGTHAQTAYNVRAAGAAAKMKIELDKTYSEEAETSIYNNQKDIAKQTINDRMFITGTTPEGNSEVITALHKNALVAFGGDRAMANKVLVDAVSDEITNLVSEGTTTSLEKAQEIFDTFFNEDLEVDGRKDIFDKPQLEFQLKRAIESGELKAIEDESRKANALVTRIQADFYSAVSDGNYAQVKEETIQRLNEQRDNNQISDAEYAAAMKAIHAFNEDPEFEANNARRNAARVVLNELQTANSALSSNPSVLFEILGFSPQEAIDRGLAIQTDDNKVEMSGEMFNVRDIYAKAFDRVASEEIAKVDFTTLNIQERTTEKQRIDSLAREAAESAVQAELDMSSQKKKERSQVQDIIDNALTRGISSSLVTAAERRYGDDPERLQRFLDEQEAIDKTPLLKKDGRFESPSLLTTRNADTTAIQYKQDLEAGNINPQQYEQSIEKLTLAVKESRSLPINRGVFSRSLESEILHQAEVLQVVGVDVNTLRADSLNLYSKVGRKASPMKIPLIHLEQAYYDENKTLLELGKNIPIQINGSLAGTLKAVKDGDVDAFAEAAGLIRMTPRELYDNSVFYFKAINQLPASFKSPNSSL